MKLFRLHLFLLIMITFSSISFSQMFTEMTDITFPGGRIFIIDLDNNGFLDIIFLGTVFPYNSENIFFQQDSGFIPEINDLLKWGVPQSYSFADKNNNGYLDGFIFLEDLPGSVWLQINNGLSGLSFSEWDDGISLQIESVSLNDYNNDGQVETLYSDGYSSGILEEDATINHSFHRNIVNGDFDNNGILEIIVHKIGDENSYMLKRFTSAGVVYNNVLSLDPNISSTIDIDSDGDMDIISLCKMYKNNGGLSFEGIEYEIPIDHYIHQIKPADIDNDGDIDMIALMYNNTAPVFKGIVVLKNNNNVFELSDTLIMSPYPSFFEIADYDNDGDIDMLVNFSVDSTKIFRNDITVINNPPQAPTGLQSLTNVNEVILSWNKAVDDHTLSEGLTYNIRIGTTSGGIDICSPHSLEDGTRLIVEMGNVQLDTFAIYYLEPGTYYWSVQAIDNCFKGSEFAVEDTFSVITDNINEIEINPIFLFPNPANNMIKIEYLMLDYYGNDHSIGIYTMDGKLVKSIPVKQQFGIIKADVSDIPPGSYIISFGNKSILEYSRKIVVFH